MALFGMLSARKKPLQPFGAGDPETGMAPGNLQQPLPTPDTPRAQGGFNAPGGLAEKLGTLSAFLLSGDGSVITEPVRQREAMRQRQQMAEQSRAAEWQDWVKQQEYLRANPKPVNNDTVADYNFIRETLSDDDAKSYLRNKTLPPPFVQKNPDGTSTIYPQGLPRGAPQSKGPPEGAISMLRSNPNLAADFDAKYGQGAAASVLGGAGSGQRPFP